MTKFKLYKKGNVFILMVGSQEIERLQNNMLSDCEVIEYFRNSITAYSNFRPTLVVKF